MTESDVHKIRTNLKINATFAVLPGQSGKAWAAVNNIQEKDCMELSDWFKGFEKGVAALVPPQREAFFAECGKNCVQSGTLQVYKQLYENAEGDIGVFFSEAGKLPGVRCEAVEKGSVYDLCFTECTCTLHRRGYVSTPQLCECSRQSVLYVLHSLWPGRTFSVTLCGSILRGDSGCRLRIEIQ